MRKTLTPCIALVASLLLFGCSNTKDVSTSPTSEISVENAIFEENISTTLKFLSSDALEGRKTGTPGIEKAATFIEEKFKANGVLPFFETYRDSFEVKEAIGYNLIGMVEGTDPQLKNEFVVIGAHYDHIGTGKPVDGDKIANGANDNASGTTTVLQLAQYFGKKKPKRTLLFCLFSAEELGLVGARHLAKRLKAQNLDVYTVFNIEMVGVPMQGRDYLAYLTGYEQSNMAEKFNEYAGQAVLGFLPEAKQYKLFQRSDNYPFFEEFQIPAQTISTFDFTNFEYYHHVKDEFEEMDIKHIDQLVQAIIPGIEKMANTAAKEIKLKN